MSVLARIGGCAIRTSVCSHTSWLLPPLARYLGQQDIFSRLTPSFEWLERGGILVTYRPSLYLLAKLANLVIASLVRLALV